MTGPGIKLRPYRIDDAPELLELFRKTVRRINSRDYNSDQVRAWASDEIDPAAWAARFEGRWAIVAEIAGRPVGFADLQRDGHLDRFFVSADHQRMGIGAAMLKALLEAAEQMNLVRITVDASLTARPFFEAHGFTVTRQQSVQVRGVDFTNFRMTFTR